ncbi:MAG: hypothetical protein WCK42_02045 [Myxococcaceae bacterium]
MFSIYNPIAIGRALSDADPMFLLLLSFLALWSGPCLLMLLKLPLKVLRVIDVVVIASILFLIVFHIMPESVEHAGWIAVVAIFLGALWPAIYQFVSRSENCNLQRSLLSLASVGVITHTLLDGVALAENAYLGFAVILHRFPEGLGIWRVAESAFNRRWGIFALSMMMLSSGVGFLFGSQWMVYASDNFVGLFEGLMAGVLLHVVFHKSHVQSTHT